MYAKVSSFSKERNSYSKGKEEEEDEAGFSKAGPSQEQEDENVVKAPVNTRSLSLGDL